MQGRRLVECQTCTKNILITTVKSTAFHHVNNMDIIKQVFLSKYGTQYLSLKYSSLPADILFSMKLWLHSSSSRMHTAGGIFGFPRLVYSPRYSRGGRRGCRLPSPHGYIKKRRRKVFTFGLTPR